jgi:putative membrane protein
VAVVTVVSHAGHDAAAMPWESPALIAAAVLTALGYIVLAGTQRAGRGWPGWSTVSFVAGCTAVVVALAPPMHAYAGATFAGHMTQHLLLGMLAPLALALGAPLTLALRSLPRPLARRLGRALRSWPAHVLAHPLVALLLTNGGLVVLYFTPLYETSQRQPAVHLLVHVHFVLAGYLFTAIMVGRDPMPGRPSVGARVVLLGVSIAMHATISQLVYAGVWVQVDAPIAQLRSGGELMYYGGDIAELMLAVALLLTVHQRRHRRSQVAAARTAGRRQAAPDAEPVAPALSAA